MFGIIEVGVVVGVSSSFWIGFPSIMKYSESQNKNLGSVTITQNILKIH